MGLHQKICKNKYQIWVFLTLFGITTAQAEINLNFEPGLSYERGGISAAGESVGSANGLGLGGRFGLQASEGFLANTRPFIGPDFKYSMLNSQFSELPGQVSFNVTQLGLGAGLSIPGLPVRGWLTFYLVDEGILPYDSGLGGPQSIVDLKVKGQAWKVGLGVMPIQQLSLNLEYIYHVYNEVRAANLAPTRFAVTLRNQVISMGLSVPFDFTLDPKPASGKTSVLK